MTEPIARFKSLAASYRTGLSYADLSPDEQWLVKGGAACAAILLWFAVALVEPWLLLVLPLLGGTCAWLIRARRRRQPDRRKEVDDWSF